jgi:hypothetical protein
VCVGNSVWDAVTSARRAKRVIVEQSAAMPLTTGDSWLHVSQLDAIVPGDRPRLALPDPDPTKFPRVDRGIAANLKTLVKDGATIQLGLGKRTTAAMMLGAFDGANDLGYFGELTVPGTIERARRGIITSRYAEVHPNRFVSCNMGNSFEDLDTIEGNPFYELASYEHTNDPLGDRAPRRHAHRELRARRRPDRADRGVRARAVRLHRPRRQLAFHIGAFLSKRGRAVTLIPSSAKGGKVSTIVPQFGAGPDRLDPARARRHDRHRTRRGAPARQERARARRGAMRGGPSRPSRLAAQRGEAVVPSLRSHHGCRRDHYSAAARRNRPMGQLAALGPVLDVLRVLDLGPALDRRDGHWKPARGSDAVRDRRGARRDALLVDDLCRDRLAVLREARRRNRAKFIYGPLAIVAGSLAIGWASA